MASSCVRRRLDVAVAPLVEELKGGLDAPICLTWELTYGCNLACVHCLSSSGRRDPRELSTAQAMSVIDQLRDLQVFYVNIRSEEHTSELQSLMRISYAVFCLKKKKKTNIRPYPNATTQKNNHIH